ncbi:MAG: GNAT family N-acetyltransferase [Saprospiraceae bacterium]|nr:GNAT family N-acetyltransferase [Saprospiraceae bacterium]
MDTFPTLYTPRLILRKITIDDIPALLQYANNRKIADRIVNIPYPYEEPTAVFRISYVHQGFKQKTRFVFSIVSKQEQGLIGEISLHLNGKRDGAEVGYWLGEPFWSQGLMKEAIGAVTQFGFQKLNLASISASCDADNIASHKVLEHNAYRQIPSNGKTLVYYIEKTT